MKKLLILLIILFSYQLVNAQYKPVYKDSIELERITKMLNLTGVDLEKSAKKQLNAWKFIGIGSLISIGGALTEKPDVIIVGGLVSTISIPLFISSAFSKKNSALRLKEFELYKLEPTTTITEPNKTINDVYVPKYKLGQTIYFYKNTILTEGKIILIDSIGLKISYFDTNKNKVKTKLINPEKVLLEKPSGKT